MGDLMLCDLASYILGLTKSGCGLDMSIHVRFVSDELFEPVLFSVLMGNLSGPLRSPSRMAATAVSPVHRTGRKGLTINQAGEAPTSRFSKR